MRNRAGHTPSSPEQATPPPPRAGHTPSSPEQATPFFTRAGHTPSSLEQATPPPPSGGSSYPVWFQWLTTLPVARSKIQVLCLMGSFLPLGSSQCHFPHSIHFCPLDTKGSSGKTEETQLRSASTRLAPYKRVCGNDLCEEDLAHCGRCHP